MYIFIWYFLIFSVLGWVYETIEALITRRRFINKGMLNGPVCPVYGFGAVIIILLLTPFKNYLPVLFIGSMVLATLIEWTVGHLTEVIFKQRWWDYSDRAHNVKGYICLRNSVTWAIFGTLAVRFIVPAVNYLVSLIPRTAGYILVSVLLLIVAVDLCLSLVVVATFNRRLKKIKEGSEKGDAPIEKPGIIHRRFLSVFPDMESLKYSEQLEQLRESLEVFRRRSDTVMKRRNERAVRAYEGILEEGQEKPFAYKLCYSKLFWIFMTGNVVGCVLETLYALILPPHNFEIRVSVVFGPFILVYGFGAVLITLILSKMYNQKDFLIFIASMVIGGGFEYMCSFIQQAVFGTVSWEYSDSAFNLGGRTNLMYSFFWGILGLWWVKDAYPLLSNTIERIPKKVGRPLTVIVSIFMVLNMAVSAAAVYRQSERVNGVPAENPVQELMDQWFPDSVLEIIYPGMQYVGKPDLPEISPPEFAPELSSGVNDIPQKMP